ncbi:hypothetical protein CWG89_10130 [Salmonella enterica subsp. enterica serovar Krefeld]|nr:hypothetical protein [Salmonella enterica subsp. enterica serovar Krefeld]
MCAATKCQAHKAILFAILVLGSARNPHVLRVRSGCSALSVTKLAATITPYGPGNKRRTCLIKLSDESLMGQVPDNSTY